MSNGQIRRYDGTTGVFIDVFTLGWRGPTDSDIRPGWATCTSAASAEHREFRRFDGLSGALIDVILRPCAYRSCGFGPDGNLYASHAGCDQVLRYNGATGAFIDVFASGGGPFVGFLVS